MLRRGPDGALLAGDARRAGPGSRSRTCRSSRSSCAAKAPAADQRLELRTNLDEWVPVDAAHPLEMRPQPDGARAPYVRVRDKLDARVARSVFYHLVELAEPAPDGVEECWGSGAPGGSSRLGSVRRLMHGGVRSARAAKLADREALRAAAGGGRRRARRAWLAERRRGPRRGRRARGARRPCCSGWSARPGGPHIILTQRTAHLRDHAGQISLPGGRIEPDDGGPAAAALREALEEIGLEPGQGRAAGRPAPLRHHHRLSHPPDRRLDRAAGRAARPTRSRSPRCSSCR